MNRKKIEIPIVSVVIPCYNVEAYIEECIESVIGQTYQEIEIICVDNNSTDDTKRTLQALQKNYPFLILTSELKKGANAARNKGLNIAKGEWVQFLDSDDIIAPTKIEHQVNFTISASKQLSFIVASYFKKSLNGKEKEIKVNCVNKWEAMARGELGITSANLFRRQALVTINGWDEALQSSQETDLMFRLLTAGYNLAFDCQPLTIIRERAAGSISKTNLSDNLRRYIEIRMKLLQYLNGLSVKEEIKQTVLQVLFDRIREYDKFDPVKSVEWYDEVIPKTFKPTVSPATTKAYLQAYRLLGFKNAQRLKRLIT